jgi:hypothetical protein
MGGEWSSRAGDTHNRLEVVKSIQDHDDASGIYLNEWRGGSIDRSSTDASITVPVLGSSAADRHTKFPQ